MYINVVCKNSRYLNWVLGSHNKAIKHSLAICSFKAKNVNHCFWATNK